MMRLFTAFALFSSLAASAKPLSNKNFSLPETSIVGGEVVSSDSRVYKMTVRLEMDYPDAIGTCSGTLIAKDLVLTAAHCVEKNPNFINVSINGGSEIIRAEAWLAHPKYEDVFDIYTDILRPVNDLGLVKLSRSVGKGASVAALPSRQMKVGEKMEMVVAGVGRTTSEDDSNPEHVLHFAWTTGTMVKAGTTEKTDLQIEMKGIQPCNGDSGGPIFAAGSKRMVVMGVSSHVNMTCTAGGRAISVRHQIPWLRKAAKQLHSASRL